MLVTASTATCTGTSADGSMNCGSSAVKKTSAFGLAAWRTKPFVNIRPAPPVWPAGRTARTDERPTNALAPSHTRYAAPIHRTAEKRSYEVATIAPRLVAESTKYKASPARMPRLDQSEAADPRLTACESTSRTAGPGVRQRAVSIIRKTLQVSQPTGIRV